MKIMFIFWLFLILFLFGKNDVFLVSGQCLNDQKSLLLTLKDNLTTAPTNSPKLVGWKDSLDCCLWDGVACDSFGHVIKLELDNQTLSAGFLNSSGSLFGLKYLERLNLAYNNFSGFTIPTGLYQLTNLTYLNLSNAGFSGEISRDLGNLRNLVTLDLSTRFPGVKPMKFEDENLEELFKNLTELTGLYLDGVNISAPGSVWCKALSSSSNLRELSLSACHLSGPIDASLSQLGSLSEFNLSSNNLSSLIPDFFADYANLKMLGLASCNLQGIFPQKILQVPTLQVLDLSNNPLITGIIPELPKNGSLRTIDLSLTKFSGLLPDSIGFLGYLSKIDLCSCNFTGPIPSTMENLASLVHFDFSDNHFNGSIPPFQNSRSLSYMDLSKNGLTGTIPSNYFEGLDTLSFVNLGFNSLTGIIPPSLFTLQSLKYLQLSNNNFTGQIIDFPNASASKLETILLTGNQLEGSIPDSFFDLEGLNRLSLSHNSFSGSLQLEKINRLPNLVKLELSYNNLSVFVNSNDSYTPHLDTLRLASCNLHEFPNLRNQSVMGHLDLSENQIAGLIPKWIWEYSNGYLSTLNLSGNHLVGLEKNYTMGIGMEMLDLHSNQLQGDFPIPPDLVYGDYSNNSFSNSISSYPFRSISKAVYFSLANNKITGAIPESICEVNFLQVLNLSNNSLTGSIPDCLFSMRNLEVLLLGTNNLSGTIPDNFPAYCALVALELSRNSLGGRIPGSLVNCTSLEVLNIGSNKIEDTFPCMLKNSTSLRVLVLQTNLFHGNLSCSFANNSWSNLQIIDIARNSFSGTLSSGSISDWRGMFSLEGNEQLVQDRTFVRFGHSYYQDTLTWNFKGQELELVKILTIFASVDLSSNHFEGSIPDTIGQLRALNSLNLSNNNLRSEIPFSMRKLTQLESLDLSSNQLTGTIPAELADLTFLSFLNLSNNHLSGRIPSGRQFATFEETSFEGNMGLCGFPLNRSCKGYGAPIPQQPPPSSNGESALDSGTKIFTALGFGVGVGIFLARRIIFPEVMVFGFTL